MSLTPLQIVREPDKYIAGQNETKCNAAVILRNHRQCMSAKREIRNEIVPNNILMIGAIRVEKTEIARYMVRIAEVPFVKVEASKFTGAGYVGRDVNSMVRDLAGAIRAYKKQQPE